MSGKALLVLLAAVWGVLAGAAAHPAAPARPTRHTRSLPGAATNIYDYMKQRDTQWDADRKQRYPEPNLSNDEKTVDKYLKYLKWQAFSNTSTSGFPPARPLGEELQRIKSSAIYQVLKSLPKGGNLHTHENHQLSKRILYELIWNSTEFQYLYMVDPSDPDKPWKLDFFGHPPTDRTWIRIEGSSYTFEEILAQQTFLGVITDEALRYPSDSGLRWRDMNPLWERGTVQLIANVNIKPLYLNALYQTSLNEGVQYLETRHSFELDERMYRINSSSDFDSTYGKEFLDPSGELDITITLEVIRNFTERNPEFIGHRRITYGTRFSSSEEVEAYMNMTVPLHAKYPEHLVGFDLVAEEDAGHSLLYFVETFLKNDFLKKFPVYLHALETNWPMDLISSQLQDDLVPTMENAFDVLLLGTRRVGHGIGFVKHPYLADMLDHFDIAVELCPVSNQLLGFFPDLRNHPASNYIQTGIPSVLGSDDAGTFGYDYFTVDWYMAFMSWELSLSSLKQLAVNSLSYSSLSSSQQTDANDKWQPVWDAYIMKTSQTACTSSFNDTPLFVDIYPRIAAINVGTRVHVFGRHFELGTCHDIKCKFGNKEAAYVAEYVTTQHLICTAPVQAAGKYDVYVALDGSTFIQTGKQLSYEITVDDSSTGNTGIETCAPVMLLVWGICITMFTI